MAAQARPEMQRSDSECLDRVDPTALENEILLGFTDLGALYPEILLDGYMTIDSHVQGTSEEFLPCRLLEHLTILGHARLEVLTSHDDMPSDYHSDLCRLVDASRQCSAHRQHRRPGRSLGATRPLGPQIE